jgi:hypothetical protein
MAAAKPLLSPDDMVARGYKKQTLANLDREDPGHQQRAVGGVEEGSHIAISASSLASAASTSSMVVSADHITGEHMRHGARPLRWRTDKSPESCTTDQIR